MYRILLSSLLAFGVIGQVNAEYVSPHSCREPFEDPFPSTFSETTYQLGVQSFQKCIKQYVLEQEQAIAEHKRAADNAIESWNDFVKRANSR